MWTQTDFTESQLRNECLFSGFMGMNRIAGQTNRVNREAFSDDLFVGGRDTIHSP